MTRSSSAAPTGWSAMASAPKSGPVILITASGFELRAEWAPGFLDEYGEDCGLWCASEGAGHPPCWTDGACWASNAQEVASDPPIGWRQIEEARNG